MPDNKNMLNDETLEKVSGGRNPNMIEYTDFQNTQTEIFLKIRDLENAGKKAEADALCSKFVAAQQDWLINVGWMPDDYNYLFSEYWDKYLKNM